MDVGSTVISTQPAIEVLNANLNKILEDSFKDIQAQLATMTGDNPNADISEIEMMQLNVQVSRFNTMITLASGIYKNLCDGEKTIAQKM